MIDQANIGRRTNYRQRPRRRARQKRQRGSYECRVRMRRRTLHQYDCRAAQGR